MYVSMFKLGVAPSTFGAAVDYVRTVVMEARRVKWATLESVKYGSLAVLALTLFVVMFVMCIDFSFIHVMKYLLDVE